VAGDDDSDDWISAAVLEFRRRVGDEMMIAGCSRGVWERLRAAGLTLR
jgi:hypothetical protein